MCKQGKYIDEKFARKYFAGGAALRGLVMGFDSRFGCDRACADSPALLGVARQMGFQIRAVPALLIGGAPVSSTRIRDAIRSGDFDAAGQMLGRAYTFAGEVLHGDELGRKLGFPTANVNLNRLQTPLDGIFAALREAALTMQQVHSAVNVTSHCFRAKGGQKEPRRSMCDV